MIQWGLLTTELKSHLSDIRCGENLSNLEKEQVRKVVEKYDAVFATNPKKPRQPNSMQHRLITGDALPVRQKSRRICSDPNNESDPSSEYSLLGLTHVMNHYLGQKFIIWVKVNCLDMSLKPGTGIPRPRTVHESLYILLEMQHTDGIPCIQNG